MVFIHLPKIYLRHILLSKLIYLNINYENGKTALKYVIKNQLAISNNYISQTPNFAVGYKFTIYVVYSIL